MNVNNNEEGQSMYRNNYVTIDLRAIAHNYQLLKSVMPSGTDVMPVIKADAYGHGLIQVARTVVRSGANKLAVALIEEGLMLRKNGVDSNVKVLVLGACQSNSIEVAIQNNLSLTVSDVEMIKIIETEAENLGKSAHIHIKVDSGMNRIGVKNEKDAIEMANTLNHCKNIILEGIYTHFASADQLSDDGHMNEFTLSQLRCFETIRAHFPPNVAMHVANSALSLIPNAPLYQYVREGISLYGYPPVKTNLPFKKALTWHAQIVHVKEINKGESVSYGGTYVANENKLVATVCVGYGDGYNRLLSNCGTMLVRGKRAPILGRVCMDQTMIDVTNIPGVKVGDCVTLIGNDGNECIDADMIANLTNTICYEVLLSITNRVPKVYIEMDPQIDLDI